MAGRGSGRARLLASKMALAARANTAQFDQRTNQLVNSVIPIVRENRDGSVDVGVGTTVEHGKWLEIGTDPHFIRPRRARWLQHNPSDPRAPQRDEWILRGRHQEVPHFGNHPHNWMSDAVRSVLPGARVRVAWPARNGYPGGQVFR